MSSATRQLSTLSVRDAVTLGQEGIREFRADDANEGRRFLLLRCKSKGTHKRYACCGDPRLVDSVINLNCDFRKRIAHALKPNKRNEFIADDYVFPDLDSLFHEPHHFTTPSGKAIGAAK